MEAPSTFGEIALLFNTVRTANVIAMKKSIIWSIDRSEFTAIMQNTNETNYIERYLFTVVFQKFHFCQKYADFAINCR